MRLRFDQISKVPSPPPLLRNGWRRLRILVAARAGVAQRLAVAFVAVAILAVAANLIAEHGTELIFVTSQRPAATPIQRAAGAAPIAPKSPTVELPPTPIDDKPAIEAVDDFERSVAGRAGVAANENAASVHAAANLLRARIEALGMAAALDTSRRTALETKLNAVLAAATRTRHLETSREELIASYRSHFEAVSSELKAALDRDWKIFGRVISRQSLVSLSRDLDDIRQQSRHLSLDADRSGPDVPGRAAAESKFRAMLDENARGLARSQGEDWVDGVRGNSELASAEAAQLAVLDEQAGPTLADFETAVRRLSAAIRTTAALPHTRPPGPTTGTGVSRFPVGLAEGGLAQRGLARGLGGPAPPAVATAGPVAAVDSSPAIERHLTGAAADPAQLRRQGLVAVISAAVLLLVLGIGVATVSSIVGPIRHFMAVTRRLAAGDVHARFSRGGIRELDALAGSFNRMAERLEAAHEVARQHQTQLETRVDERTRQLQHLADHDPLTGLPNRRQLLERLDDTLREAASKGAQVGVFFLDLDNFKYINDSMGHAFGDLVLKQIAGRLADATATGGYAARLGGDEFTVVYQSAAGLGEIERVGTSLVTAFERPLLIGDRELLLSVSVGASVYPDHELSPDALLRAADAALFEAKTLGRGRMNLFSHELLETAALKFRIEQDLRRAVERGEFELLFQPEVTFDSLGIQLVEALLRWRLPDGRHVSPAEFLTVAEESGLITTINDWVLKSAVECAARWHHGAWPNARIAVNVSARQLLDTRFVDRLAALLAQHGLPPRCIEIELTETVLQTGAATVHTLRQLRNLGISIALDDFGTGYSSLTSLEQLPLTRVKLDRSLIASIDTSARSLAIARAVIGLCKNLQLEVTAEGVERTEQLALLTEHPGLSVQGFLISRPLASEHIPAAVAKMPGRLQELLLEVPENPHSKFTQAQAAG